MWYRHLIIGGLIYLFALLQQSFFAHFSLWGAVPNLVFVFFVLIIFFEKENRSQQISFYAIISGLLLDVASSADIGISVVLLVALGFGIKKVQASFFDSRNRHPFLHFLIVFFISFLIYDFLLSFYLRFSGSGSAQEIFNLGLAGRLIYNLIFASVFFLACKKFLGVFDSRQLSLFAK